MNDLGEPPPPRALPPSPPATALDTRSAAARAPEMSTVQSAILKAVAFLGRRAATSASAEDTVPPIGATGVDEPADDLSAAETSPGTPPDSARALSREISDSVALERALSQAGGCVDLKIVETLRDLKALGCDAEETWADADAGAHSFDEDHVFRPAAYPVGNHMPLEALGPLEEHFGFDPRALRNLEIIDELKGPRLEGLYNLSLLVLGFSLFFLIVRNVNEHGWLFGLSYLCTKEIVRDIILCLLYSSTAASAIVFCGYSLVLAHVHLGAGRSFVLACHHGFNFLAMFASSVIIVRSPVNPLAGGGLSVLIVICVLKTHSYVATNMLLSEEREAKRNARLLKRSATGPQSITSASHTACASYDSLLSAQSNCTAGGGGNHNNVLGTRAQSSPVRNGSGGGRAPAPDVGSESLAASSIGGGFPGSSPGNTGLRAFPKNVTVRDYAYFIAAPTLTYELNYPRASKVRGEYIAVHFAQLLACVGLQYILFLQFCVPVFLATQSVSFAEIALLVLRLTNPAFGIFLLMLVTPTQQEQFYGFFHCVLSLIAELLRFADRRFYQEWWNAGSIKSFWRRWNVPVHEWCLRHVFIELNGRRNLSASTSSFVTFLLSAILHEYCAATAFKVMPGASPWMFLGMLVQLPLIYLDRFWKAGSRTGNFVMWISLFLGQPLMIILYVRGYLKTHEFLMCPS